jgi:hypothetical protein
MESLLPGRLNLPQAVLLVLAVAIAIGFFVAGSTSATDFGAYNPTWDGTSELRTALDRSGDESTVLTDVTEYPSNVSDRPMVLVFSPQRPYTETEIRRVRSFVKRGGTLVVAEDTGPVGNQILAGIGATARFNGTIVRDNRYNVRVPAMPIARNVSHPPTGRSTTRSRPYVSNVSRLTLNYATVVSPGDARVLVRTSEYGYLDRNANGDIDTTERLGSYPIVTIESVGRGQVIALSDPSIFINTMADQPDNRRFRENLLASHGSVVLDHSHSRLPPLAVVSLAVRSSVGLQVSIAGAMGLFVLAWGRGDLTTGYQWLHQRVNQQPVSGSTPVDMTAEEIATYLERKHPSWSTERIKTIAGLISTDRTKSKQHAGPNEETEDR